MFVFAACSQGRPNSLDQLGKNSDFSDVEIGDDFKEPGEEDNIVDDGGDDEIEIINFKNTFYLDSGLYALAHNNANRWDGCKSGYTSQGGYNSDSKCGRAFFHPKFAGNLNEFFFRCISDAAKVAGYPQPNRIFIKHLGSYNDREARGSSRLSNHAYARALDISNFNLYDKNGKLYRVSTLLRNYKGSQAKFYDEFRQCWSESMPSGCRPGKTEYLGSIGHRSSKLGGNTLHNDHIHLSLPLCAG